MTHSLDRLLDSTASITLGEINLTSALQHRVDVKYLVPMHLVEEIVQELATDHSCLVVDDVRCFRYRTTYFDTPDLTCYRAHGQRRRRRFKARIRRYEDSGLTRVEVKLKDGRGATVKDGLTVHTGNFDDLDGTSKSFVRGVLLGGSITQDVEALVAALTVSHRRATLAFQGGGARLTIDTDLRFQAHDSNAIGDERSGAGHLRPDVALLETKSPGGRSRADCILRAAGVWPVTVSKYCVGTALTRPDVPSQPWRPLMSRYFTAPSIVDAAA